MRGLDIMVILETDRLVVRHLTTADAAFIFRLLNDPGWLRFIGDRGINGHDDAVRYIETGPMAMYASLGFGFYAVELKATGCLAGICGLAKRDYLDDVDLGFAFLPEYRGKGYAFDAAGAVLGYARSRLGLGRILATTRKDNTDSARLLEKLGFRFERMVMHPDGDRELRLFATADIPSA
jgi:RimJ/RimL family protein N-acetyltransferase